MSTIDVITLISVVPRNLWTNKIKLQKDHNCIYKTNSIPKFIFILSTILKIQTIEAFQNNGYSRYTTYVGYMNV